uniref:NADH dehydrogenase subunit 6 n=1 Tax=Homoeocerus dilatatus TaxID=763216 RepID=UPI002A816D24|nr:NADH dehydrogenase subunit 6 [Homoeocerus dilatatus]WOZ14001.1 NADH dehydrogenase subunit 6 [Homoeocerus dilatatus]
MMLSLIMMMLLSFIFIWLNHPISMGITIITQTIVISMIVGLSLNSFWFSYIITIIMLSGMLVLFIYMASVASNEKFYTSFKLIAFSIMVMISGVIMQFCLDTDNNEMLVINHEVPIEMALSTLFNCKFKMITMMMVLYLMFTMVTVSFIVNISEGPLRIHKK